MRALRLRGRWPLRSARTARGELPGFRALVAPAEFHRTPAVDDRAEQFRGAFGVVDRRMRLARVPELAGSLDGTAEHGLPVGKAGERDGVETAERMERTALVRRAPDRRVEEAE